MPNNIGFELRAPNKPPLRVYKRIGIGFISLSAILLLVVMNMALSRATIIVQPDTRQVPADLLVTVREDGLHGGDILGKISSVPLSREATFQAMGEGEEVPAKAHGIVVVYNNSSRNQPLIATTRFLSKNNVLFRLKKDILVPAGGSVSAEIAADKEGKGGEIGPDTFTIPGLPASLQTQIFAKSEAAMAGGMAKLSIVTQEDIDSAVKQLADSMLSEGTVKLKESLNGSGDFEGVAVKGEIKSRETDVDPGEAATEFTVKLNMDVVGAAYSSDIKIQAEKTLASMLASDRSLLSSNLGKLEPEIEKYDLQEKTANLKVPLIGETIISADSPVFDREKLTGMSTDEVKDYLEKNAGIKNVEITFFPFWIDKIPNLRDHIRVIVK